MSSTKEIPTPTREIIINMCVANGEKPKVAADATGVKVDTVRKILRIYRTEGRIAACPRGGRGSRSPLLDDDDASFIRNLIDEDCTLTLEKIKSILELRRRKYASCSTISRCIKGFFYSFKRITHLPQRARDEEVQAQRLEFCQAMTGILEHRENFFYVDEVGFQVNMRSFYGRSRVNTRAIQMTTALRSRNFTVIASMAVDCVFHYAILNGPANSDHFKEFAVELLRYIKDTTYGPAFVIMDNVAFHKRRDILQLFETGEHEVQFRFLPPYTPQLNPIENVFSQWKSKVRSLKPTTEPELEAAIHSAAAEITSMQCSNYYRHCENNIFKCLAGNEMIG